MQTTLSGLSVSLAPTEWMLPGAVNDGLAAAHTAAEQGSPKFRPKTDRKSLSPSVECLNMVHAVW